MQDLAPPENETNAFLGQSPMNRSGLNSSGSGQYLANSSSQYEGSKRVIVDIYGCGGVLGRPR
jgi:hypothetical protein